MFKIVCTLVLCMLTCCCAHRHSKESDEDNDFTTAPILLTLNIISEPDFRTSGCNILQTSDINGQYRKRFLIEARQNNTVITRKTVFPDTLSLIKDSLFLSIDLELQTSKYDLSVWMDYTKENTDCHYITDHLNNITCVEPYCGNTITKECLYGHKTIDLREFGNQRDLHVETNINIHPPVAKYEIVTTDVEEFIKQTSWQPNKSYHVIFTYLFFYPMVYNAYEGTVKDSWSDVSFEIPLNITDKKQKECTLGFDYILADTTTNIVMLALTVKDENDKEIITSSPIKIPYRQGYFTPITGRFLTKNKSGGFEINTEFDDEINIDIDNLINQLK